MIRNKWLRPTFTYAFLIALVIHVVILIFVKKKTYNLESLSHSTRFLKEPLRMDQIKVMRPEEVEKFRKVGIKDGKKDTNRPDIVPKKNALVNIPKPPLMKNLSLGNLKPQLDKLPVAVKGQAKSEPAPPNIKNDRPNLLGKTFLNESRTKNVSPFYFNYKDQKVIPRSQEQEDLKSEAIKNFNTGPINKATERISNFEIRYERPEGVSEDELNSDEKAYYSFYVRSYKNYFAKIYSNYERLVVERPGLAKVFDRQHLLIGKIDYDEAGNIITVRILKSSESDDLHYFFEETLKQLSQPNPPKVFTKNRKQFSIYYQLQIN